MRRFLVPGVVVAIAIGFLALLAYGVSSQGTNTSIDNQVARGDYPTAPNATTRLALLGSASTDSLAEFRGKVVVLNVFASWCIPCAQEAPILERAQQLLSRHDGTVVGVTYLDNTLDAESFVHQHHVTYPVLNDVSGNFVRAFAVNGVPETFIINRQGRIQALRRYQLNNTWLSSTLPHILSERS